MGSVSQVIPHYIKLRFVFVSRQDLTKEPWLAWTHRHLPVSASWVLELKVWDTTPGLCLALWVLAHLLFKEVVGGPSPLSMVLPLGRWLRKKFVLTKKKSWASQEKQASEQLSSMAPASTFAWVPTPTSFHDHLWSGHVSKKKPFPSHMLLVMVFLTTANWTVINTFPSK